MQRMTNIEVTGADKVLRLSNSFVLLLLVNVSLQLSLPLSASAEYGANTVSTLRTPLIPTAPSSPPYASPMEGQPPPVGDGMSPAPVVGGHLGLSIPPVPSHVPGIPPVPAGPEGKAMVNGYVAPYLTPPPENPAPDPGICDPPPDFGPPPVSVTSINPGGGISGNAPTQRWGGQTTRDYGNGSSGSTCRDFGQKLSEKPDKKIMPQFSEDGPRQSTAGSGRSSNLPGAQATSVGHGNRINFKRARLTIAPY